MKFKASIIFITFISMEIEVFLVLVLSERRKPFFLFFMFTGMGVGFILIPVFGGLSFPAAMFIGMGLGFLFDSIIVVEERKMSVEVPVRIGGIIMMLVGLLMIIGGSIMLAAPRLLERLIPYFIGLGFIAGGAYVLVAGLSIVKKS
ncbi:MAG: hypothetical protein DRN49_05960 [Thaumarchaeota archaeon]|nr:MAG: hypothetical protein DRN49_05960 [Nitrososphaerota archaeon]